METSKFVQITEGRIEAGIYTTLGHHLNFFIQGIIVSEDGRELTVQFTVEGHSELYRWCFNVEELQNED